MSLGCPSTTVDVTDGDLSYLAHVTNNANRVATSLRI